MVFGYNLHYVYHYVALFAILRPVFCKVFSVHLLFCHARGGRFWSPELNFGSLCRHFGQGIFLVNFGVPENMILWWKWSPTRFGGGICARGMDSRGPRRPLGRTVSPQTLSENCFTGICPVSFFFYGPWQSLVGPWGNAHGNAQRIWGIPRDWESGRIEPRQAAVRTRHFCLGRAGLGHG